MRKPIRIEILKEKDKEELYNAFAGKPQKKDAIPDLSALGDGEFAMVDDGTDQYLAYRRGDKIIKITGTVV